MNIYCLEYMNIYCLEYINIYCLEYINIYCLESQGNALKIYLIKLFFNN